MSTFYHKVAKLAQKPKHNHNNMQQPTWAAATLPSNSFALSQDG